MATIKVKMLPDVPIEKIDNRNIEWSTETRYKNGHIISYLNNLYNCIEGHTSTLSFDSSKFDLLSKGTLFIEDETRRTVTDVQVSNWNAKADATSVYTKTETSDLISGVIGAAPDLLNTLSEIAEALNNDSNFSVTIMTELGKKVEKVEGKGLSTNDLTNDLKNKVDGIEDNANKYIHPEFHLTSEITEDVDHRFVSDAKILEWDGKASSSVATETENGLLAFEDKIKLNTIAANANNYTHPEYHLATEITQDEDHRMVSDLKIQQWDANVAPPVVTETVDGLMSFEDKIKLNSVEESANNYSHPSTHSADMIEETSEKQFVSQTEIDFWSAKQTALTFAPYGVTQASLEIGAPGVQVFAITFPTLIRPYVIKKNMDLTWSEAIYGTDYTISYDEAVETMSVDFIELGSYKINY